VKEDEIHRDSVPITGIWRVVASVIASTNLVSISDTIPKTQHSSAGGNMRTPQARGKKGRFLPKGKPIMVDADDTATLLPQTKMMWLPTETYPEGVVRISCDYPMPNRWYRFWMRVLIGVRWKYVDPPQD
jgi:hypothetical protein